LYGKSPFLMGKLTISMAIFNSFLYVYQRVYPSFLPSISRYETTHLLFGAPLFCGDVDNVRRGGFGAIHMGM
jgi:hypothetical protein